MLPEARRAVARRGAAARWIRKRFGSESFATLGLPGGDMVDAGLADLAHGRVTAESLLVSLAAPRFRREGVPLTEVHANPEERLFQLLERDSGDLAHARQRLPAPGISFADACRGAGRSSAVRRGLTRESPQLPADGTDSRYPVSDGVLRRSTGSCPRDVDRGR
jgi:hypothetical protein